MSLEIRRASCIKDRQEMLDLLERNLGASQEKRFNWRHTENPAGNSWSWFVHEPGRTAAVGLASVFPRHMWVDRKQLTAGQVGDFVIDSSYRSLGPAVLLQRTTFEPVDSGKLAFCYDCPPHDRGMATFVRLGMSSNCDVLRYALLLRSDEYFAKKLGKHVWTRPLVGATNVFLAMRKSSTALKGLEISEFDDDFGEEFSQLDRRVAAEGEVRASRSAEDMNWRYRKDPLRTRHLPNGNVGTYRMLMARKGGELLAFVIFFIQTDGIACIVDLFGVEISKIAAPLLSAVTEISCGSKVWAIYAFCSTDNELNSILPEARFRRRELSVRTVAYAPGSDIVGRLGSGLRWPFSHVEVLQ